MKWLVKWGVKKWLVGVANTALVTYKDKIDRARAFLSLAISKVDAVTAYLKSLDAKLADNKITVEESDAAIKEAIALAANLVNKES